MMRKPNWTNLMPELVNCIASQLIADDLTDFIRFRAVCRPWCSSTEETRTRAGCLHPRNWIMPYKPTRAEPVEFYNTFTHKSFWFNPTVYLDQYSLFRSFDCLIILQNKNTQEFALLNPFMRYVIQLPSKIVSHCPNAPAKLEDVFNPSEMNCRLTDVHVTSSSTIVLRFSTSNFLVWTKPGDENWVYAEFKDYCINGAVFYDNRILGVAPDLGVVQINFANEMSSDPPHVESVFPRFDRPIFETRHLVVYNDTIFLVAHPISGGGYSFEMFKLDLKNMTCVPSTCLGNCSLFLGVRAFAVSSKSCLIPANCIYFCNRYYGAGGKTMCNLSTGKFSTEEPFLNPNPLVRRLIHFCLEQNPILVRQRDGSIIYNED